jgi:hypothetical protein
MLCDDYLWSREETARADVLGCPKLAIDAFTNIHRRQIDFPIGAITAARLQETS